MTSGEYGRPITGVMPMGGLMNTDRTGDPGVGRIVAVGDGFCHTDPAFAYGLSFSLAHGRGAGTSRHRSAGRGFGGRALTWPCPGQRPASGTSWSVPPTTRGRGGGSESRWRFAAETGAIRSSRSPGRWPPPLTMTEFCDGQSAVSGCSIPSLLSTRTTTCTRESRASSRISAHRPRRDRRAGRCSPALPQRLDPRRVRKISP